VLGIILEQLFRFVKGLTFGHESGQAEERPFTAEFAEFAEKKHAFLCALSGLSAPSQGGAVNVRS
jgi:hypothetical protein